MIAFVTLAVFVVVLIYSRSLTPKYQTSASIEVTKPIATEGMEQWLYYKGHPMETAIRQIKSRICIETALRRLNLLTEKSTDADIRQHVEDILSRLAVTGIENTNVLTVSLLGPDKESLAPIVNAICGVYKELEADWAASDDKEAIKFLNERITYYRGELEKAEGEMIAFQSQNVNTRIANYGDNISSRFDLRSKMTIEATQLKEEINEIQARRGAWDIELSPELRSLIKQRDDAKARRDAILQQFTENHPSYLRANDELASVEKMVGERKTEFEKDFNARMEQAIGQRQQRQADIARQLAAIEADLSALPREQIEHANIEMRISLVRNLYSMFYQRLEEKKISQQSKTGGVTLLGNAATPIKIYPVERLHQTIGLAMGMLLGFAFAFLLETMDTSIRTIEEIEEFVGVPVLGVASVIVMEPLDTANIESGPGRLLPGSPGAVLHYHPRDSASEAYRALTSTLEFTFFNEGHRVLLIASATPQEGKTTSASNIAIGLATSGKKTILLDCNLRHPGITKIYSLSGHAGLAEALGGFVPWRVCAYPTMVENLDVIPTGALPSHPVELIKSGLPALLSELSTIYGAIIIDSPPVLPVADATIISSMAGGTLLVYSQGRAPRDVLVRAKIKLETAKGKVIGTFLNKVKPEGELGRNYYYYYYAYYPNKEKRSPRPRAT